MSRVEHYCPKAGPIFISAWLLQMSRVEHYCPKAGPIHIDSPSATSELQNFSNNQIKIENIIIVVEKYHNLLVTESVSTMTNTSKTF
jgi:hypothetical protein